jgi:hypothetical protein
MAQLGTNPPIAIALELITDLDHDCGDCAVVNER